MDVGDEMILIKVALGTHEERERKPQVNGEGGDQKIQIKVKLGTCRRTLRPAGGSLRARFASRSSRQRWGSAPRLLCSARGGMWAVAAEPGRARRAPQLERKTPHGALRLSGVAGRCVRELVGCAGLTLRLRAASGRGQCPPRLHYQEKDQDGQSDGRKCPHPCRAAVRAMSLAQRATQCA